MDALAQQANYYGNGSSAAAAAAPPLPSPPWPSGGAASVAAKAEPPPLPPVQSVAVQEAPAPAPSAAAAAPCTAQDTSSGGGQSRAEPATGLGLGLGLGLGALWHRLRHQHQRYHRHGSATGAATALTAAGSEAGGGGGSNVDMPGAATRGRWFLRWLSGVLQRLSPCLRCCGDRTGRAPSTGDPVSMDSALAPALGITTGDAAAAVSTPGGACSSALGQLRRSSASEQPVRGQKPSGGPSLEVMGMLPPEPEREEAVGRQLVARREPVAVQVLELISHCYRSRVYKGIWQGHMVVLKVLKLPDWLDKDQRLQQIAVMEAAVSSALRHPNLVQTYDYSVRSGMDSNLVVSSSDDGGGGEGRAAAAAAAAAGAGGTTPPGGATSATAGPWRSLPPSTPLWSAAQHALHGTVLQRVLEYCDLGTLRDALDRGVFHRNMAVGTFLGGGGQGRGGGSAALAATRGPGRAGSRPSESRGGTAPVDDAGDGGGGRSVSRGSGYETPSTGGETEVTCARALPLVRVTVPAPAPAVDELSGSPTYRKREGGGSAPDSDLVPAAEAEAEAAEAEAAEAEAAEGRQSVRAEQRPAYRYGLMLAVACDVAAALQHLHVNGIVHGDVKASNVLLNSGVAATAKTAVVVAAEAAAAGRKPTAMAAAAAAVAGPTQVPEGSGGIALATPSMRGGASEPYDSAMLPFGLPPGGGGRGDSAMLPFGLPPGGGGRGDSAMLPFGLPPGGGGGSGRGGCTATSTTISTTTRTSSGSAGLSSFEQLLETGVVAKVSDFGLALPENKSTGPRLACDTLCSMTYMSPELLMYGHRSPPQDVYAYGLMLFELFTGMRAFQGVPRALLPHKVVKSGLRPVFPPHTPADYRALAERCWLNDPKKRPNFETVLDELQRMRQRAAEADEAAAQTLVTDRGQGCGGGGGDGGGVAGRDAGSCSGGVGGAAVVSGGTGLAVGGGWVEVGALEAGTMGTEWVAACEATTAGSNIQELEYLRPGGGGSGGGTAPA